MFSLVLFASQTAFAQIDGKDRIKDPIFVAVASNFAHTARAITKSFEAETGYQARLSFGSSGKLYAQIVHGAPFSVFLSADTEKPAALANSDMVAARATYAMGRLMIWIPEPGQQDWPAQLADPTLGKIALANPRLAPYGEAASQTLQHLNLLTTRNRWITGENIAQTFQFVDTGNAGAGFIARSQMQSGAPLKGLVEVVPATWHDPIRQDAVLLKKSRDNPAAIAFYEFLTGPIARRLIEQDGYTLPPNTEKKHQSLTEGKWRKPASPQNRHGLDL